ncbi:hypothetical protein [Escherichia coli]|uniref:hypothetical protein n=1 Tax=Escherichia coli TaxID=562 RepID=UPI00391C46DC
MHRIDTKTAQKDKFGAGKNGFTRGNPQTGTPATDLDDDYFDMLQEELCSVVEASGASLEKGRHDQLLTALRALLLSRKNPFGDIKSDGTVQTALANLGLGEAAKLNVGTTAGTVAAGDDSRFARGLGVGQTWVSTPRALNTTYTNSTGKPIFIAVYLRTTSPTPSAVEGVLTTGDIEISFSGGGLTTSGAYKSAMLYAPIPDGATYHLSSVTVGAGIAGWWELR